MAKQSHLNSVVMTGCSEGTQLDILLNYHKHWLPSKSNGRWGFHNHEVHLCPSDQKKEIKLEESKDNANTDGLLLGLLSYLKISSASAWFLECVLGSAVSHSCLIFLFPLNRSQHFYTLAGLLSIVGPPPSSAVVDKRIKAPTQRCRHQKGWF